MPAKRHILICGTGRAGTTLLVRILAEAGLDTGFDQADFETAESNIGRAGLETGINRKTADALPTVVKSPWVVNALPELLSERWIEIGLAIVPVRELWAAAESRRQVHARALEAGIKPRRAPGGLWKTRNPDRQEEALALQFYKTVQPLVAARVPIAFLSFPQFAGDREYFLDTLAPPLDGFGVTRDALEKAHAAQSQPELISVPE